MDDGEFVRLNVGCFNVGIHQPMLLKENHKKSFRHLLAKSFEEGSLHLLGLCEVGGHRKGLNELGIPAHELLPEALPVEEFRVAIIQNYMSVWHQAGTARCGGVSLKLREAADIVQLTSPALEPHLVILDFSVTAQGHDGKEGRLVVGQLHIRTPADKHTPSEETTNG